MPTPVLGRELQVSRSDIASSTVNDCNWTPASGQVLLTVERFALTANNVTYAALGDMLRYWQFFPAQDGYGVVPAWGYATVVGTDVPGIDVGESWYGYLPMATHVLITPGRVDPRTVMDASPHREGLAGTYQRYERLGVVLEGEVKDLTSLYRPLFMTAFLLDDLVTDPAAGHGEVGRVIVTSASSKTGTALAHLLAGRGDVEVIGITSSGNKDAVSAAGLCDQVLDYRGVDQLFGDGVPTAIVDLAGRPDVTADLHRALGESLSLSLVVGMTHHDVDRSAAPTVPGRTPTMFFAPGRAEQRAKDWGAADMLRRMEEVWAPFLDSVREATTIRHLAGLDAADDAWRRLVAGDIDPGEGLVVLP